MNMVWAQIFPFVALQFYEEGDTISKDVITLILICSLSSWLLLIIAFFCAIDLSYAKTFIETKTAPQYTCELYHTATDDSLQFDSIFGNRLSFTRSIHEEVRQWVASNIVRWQREKPDWFKIEMIPNDFLPTDVLEEEGGEIRRRASILPKLSGNLSISTKKSSSRQNATVHPN